VVLSSLNQAWCEALTLCLLRDSRYRQHGCRRLLHVLQAFCAGVLTQFIVGR
jgi:hypothetical protein